jgi:glutaredoxin
VPSVDSRAVELQVVNVREREREKERERERERIHKRHVPVLHLSGFTSRRVACCKRKSEGEREKERERKRKKEKERERERERESFTRNYPIRGV